MDYKKPKNFAEMVAEYTGGPVDDTPVEPLTEEQRAKRAEWSRMFRSMTREERIEWNRKADEKWRDPSDDIHA